MFKSQATGKQYGPGIKPVRVVLERRSRTYMNREGVVSHGHEIVREQLVGEDEALTMQEAEVPSMPVSKEGAHG